MKKVQTVTKFNQNTWLKWYIDINADLKFKVMNNVAFGKILENVRKHRGIKLITTERTRNYLVSEQNHHTTQYFYRTFIRNRNKKDRDT